MLTNIFGVTVFVLEVRSWSGPFSCKSPSSEILHSEKKGPCPQAQLSPSEVQSWLRGGRSQLAVPSGPGPQTLNCHPWLQGNRCQDLAGPQAPQAAQNSGREGPGPTEATHADGRCHEVAEAGMRERFIHYCLKAWAQRVGGLGEDSGALWDTGPPALPWAPRSPAGLRPGELEGPGEKAGIYLLPHSPPDNHHSTNRGLNGPLMAAH